MGGGEQPPFRFKTLGISKKGAEHWGIGGAAGKGLHACFEAVKVDPKCAGDYFNYVERGDKNCGCNGKPGLEVRNEGKSQ